MCLISVTDLRLMSDDSTPGSCVASTVPQISTQDLWQAFPSLFDLYSANISAQKQYRCTSCWLSSMFVLVGVLSGLMGRAPADTQQRFSLFSCGLVSKGLCSLPAVTFGGNNLCVVCRFHFQVDLQLCSRIKPCSILGVTFELIFIMWIILLFVVVSCMFNFSTRL